ncbi:glycosyltransferase family 4 protein [Spirochaeta isovalerica]|uniref:Glycosyltransferase involved in cell wall biosynthesis n=1 Tax=Spirochaeta isovalerica TaxID=150 RepID=A0A841RF18_9SPIO|nr:glycosyltransferase family 4 protein [Spirochaeta isovalerica]MBB6480952.1 glycosyltransferase involved in cell wall biosynthesis [Spirochaeta isovalerica]
MKVLVLYEFPPSPGGLATQGDLLYKGLIEMGIDAHAAHFESEQEKEWYYRWFRPDVVAGVGFWGYSPQIIIHPQSFGLTAVPWLVADGYIANYQDILNKLPLIFVTSHWVKEMYVRDGIREENIEVLPVGCDTAAFSPKSPDDIKITSVREALSIKPDQLMILTIGGDAASKGGQEMMHALALVDKEVPDWRYVCKVWPQDRTILQNSQDFLLARQLGIEKKVIFQTSIISRNFVPYLLGACDIYAAPSRLEGFGMPQVEAGACGKAVISINAMGPKDTLIHGKTALLADIAQEITLRETTLGAEAGFRESKKIVFDKPRVVDYRASIPDIADSLFKLMNNPSLRKQLGNEARKRAVKCFDYHVVAEKFVETVQRKLEIK